VPIRLYDTLSGELKALRAPGGAPIKLYQCGPTVYASPHIGHARPAVMYDTLVRYLKYRGYEVVHVLNFTDVDDKIIQRAQREGRAPLELAAAYAQEYLEIMDLLGVERADYYPRVSEHIEDIIRLVQGLIEKGYAYVAAGDVYFDVTAFPEYGQLSNRRLEELLAGARVEVGAHKRHPGDFALWKAAKPGEISWESPWGPGRPGWHIECSALALRYLGETLDIHGGGTDLIFPHHENERAQTEAYTGKSPFVHIWMHCGLLQLSGDKMSKSTGNVVAARAAIERYGPEAVRFYLLSSHYRKPVNFDAERLEHARRGWERLRNALRNIEAALVQAGAADSEPAAEEVVPAVAAVLSGPARELITQVQTVEGRFQAAMDDDLNTSLALAALFELAGAANRYLGGLSGAPDELGVQLLRLARQRLQRLGQVLGIVGSRETAGQGALTEQLIELLVEVRSLARSQRQWELADLIRDRLQALGITVEDTPAGTRWYRN